MLSRLLRCNELCLMPLCGELIESERAVANVRSQSKIINMHFLRRKEVI